MNYKCLSNTHGHWQVSSKTREWKICEITRVGQENLRIVHPLGLGNNGSLVNIGLSGLFRFITFENFSLAKKNPFSHSRKTSCVKQNRTNQKLHLAKQQNSLEKTFVYVVVAHCTLSLSANTSITKIVKQVRHRRHKMLAPPSFLAGQSWCRVRSCREWSNVDSSSKPSRKRGRYIHGLDRELSEI